MPDQPDNRTPWWQTLLMQLPAILMALAAFIGSLAAYNSSRQNAVKIEQHGEVIEQTFDKVDKMAKTVGRLDSAPTKAPPKEPRPKD